MVGLLRKWWEEFRLAVARVERESLDECAGRRPGTVDWRVIGVVGIGCVTLSLLEYYGSSSDYKILEPIVGWFSDEPAKELRNIFRRGDRAELFRLAYWSLATFLLYFVLPAAFVKVVLREKLADYGLRLKGIFSHAWIYVTMYLAVMPFVVGVAFSEAFQKTYPFYGNAHASAFDFFAWQALYALQFFSLEFFFRGFLIHGVRARFGFYAILLSVMPYCMIHFGKPLPETLGAVIAGLVLGAISLFTRSIWLGVAIHVSVAVSMDVLSLTIQGKLF